MERLLRSDDWLIDRVAQPIVSWYEFTVGGTWWILSVVTTALGYIGLSAGLLLADDSVPKIALNPALKYFAVILTLLMGSLATSGRYLILRKIQANAINPYRYSCQGGRIGTAIGTIIALTSVSIAAIVDPITPVLVCIVLYSLISGCMGDYFMACRGMTPNERKEREEKELLKHAPQPI